jgi:hypothetical protein
MIFDEDEEILKEGKYFIKEYDDRDVFSPSLYLRSNKIDNEIIELIEKYKLPNITINDQMGWKGKDSKIEFISKLPKRITGLEFMTNSTDVSAISDFKNCERLKLNDAVRGKIDFSELKKLKVLEARWDEKQFYNLDNSENLEKLYLSNFRGVDLHFFKELKKMTNLDLFLCSKLMSLNGIEELKKLEVFNLDTANKLIDIESLHKTNKNLLKLDLSNCKNLVEIDSITSLVSLERLCLNSIGKNARLSNLKELKNLKEGFIDKKIILDAGELIEKYNITLCPIKLVFHD